MIAASSLGGLSREAATKYGMPHIGAEYYGEGVNAYRPLDRPRCPVCGRPASNVHHEPAKGSTGTWTLRTKVGIFVLRPALIALCGTGTTGCHGERHAGLLRVSWRWDDPVDEEAWLNGFLLSHGFEPHDPRLYGYGCWTFERNGEEVCEWRG